MNRLLARFIQIVVCLFAAFGGFLTEVAPPAQTNPKFAVGLSSFFVLIVLLIISAVAKDTRANKFRKRWITAGVISFAVAILAGLLYPLTLNKLTYSYPPPPDEPTAWRVNGWELTRTAQDFIKENPGNHSPGELELKLPYEEIWTASSVEQAKLLLIVNYICLVLAISTAIFCLLEANSRRR